MVFRIPSMAKEDSGRIVDAGTYELLCTGVSVRESGTGSGNQNTGSGSNDNRSSALQTFNTQKATGQIDNDAVFTGSLNDL